MLFLLFLACMIATYTADEVHYGKFLMGITYFIFMMYGIAYVMTKFIG